MHVTMLRLSFAYAIFTAPLVPASLFDNTSHNSLRVTPFRVGFSQLWKVLKSYSHDFLFLFSQWYSTPGIVGCMQSTSSSMWSLQANSEKFTKYSLKMSLLDFWLFGENAVFWKHLIHQLLQFNCIQWKTQLLLMIFKDFFKICLSLMILWIVELG